MHWALASRKTVTAKKYTNHVKANHDVGADVAIFL
jgi:hypothetical protein